MLAETINTIPVMTLDSHSGSVLPVGVSVNGDGVLAAPIDTLPKSLGSFDFGLGGVPLRGGAERVLPAPIDAIVEAMLDPGGGIVSYVRQLHVRRAASHECGHSMK